MNEDYEFIVLKLKEISRETNENVRNEELKKIKAFFFGPDITSEERNAKLESIIKAIDLYSKDEDEKANIYKVLAILFINRLVEIINGDIMTEM